jgi:hypothetical protein
MGSDYDLIRVERRIGRQPKKRGIAVGRNAAAAIAIRGGAGSLELAIVHLGSGRVRSSRTLPVESVQALSHTAHGFVVAAGKRLVALK